MLFIVFIVFHSCLSKNMFSYVFLVSVFFIFPLRVFYYYFFALFIFHLVHFVQIFHFSFCPFFCSHALSSRSLGFRDSPNLFIGHLIIWLA